jgi:hypothetical protein
MTSRIARLLVRLYPGAWRDRYETEMLALLEDGPPTWWQVLDLARGLLSERTPRPIAGGLIGLFWLAAANLALAVAGLLVERAFGRFVLVGGLPIAFLIHPFIVLGLSVSMLFHRHERLDPASIRPWRVAAIVLGVWFYAQDAATGWSRGRMLGPAVNAFIVLGGLPGLTILLLDLRSSKPWFFKPPSQPLRPDVARFPLGLEPDA